MIPKFRAWDKNQQIMRGVRGLFWTKNNLVAHCSPADNKFDEFFTTILNDGEYHLMQSTGLKDLKGVEIFEGDVVWIIDKGEMDNGWGWFEEVKFRNGSFMADDDFLINSHHRCVVRGNIYESPELSEEEK